MPYTSRWKIGMVTILKELKDGRRAHKKDTPKGGHLISNLTSILVMDENIRDILFRVHTKKATIRLCANGVQYENPIFDQKFTLQE